MVCISQAAWEMDRKGSKAVHTPGISGLSPSTLDPPSKKEREKHVFPVLILSTWAGTTESQHPIADTKAVGAPPSLPGDPSPRTHRYVIAEASASSAFLSEPPYCPLLPLACPLPGIPLHTSTKGKLRPCQLIDTWVEPNKNWFALI